MQANVTIANEILSQLGGSKFSAMTGARDFVICDRALMFRLPRGLAKHGINSVVVRLDGSDTYTVLFNKRTNGGVNVTGIASRTLVYADQLQEVFTAETGLDTHL